MPKNLSRTIRIGTGAGYSGDRIEPAVALAQAGNLDYLVFECLAERTIALAQQRKANNPKLGYDPLLEARMEACLALCVKNNIKIITNMGAANPVAAVVKIAEIASRLGLTKLKLAAITGDDVLIAIKDKEYQLLETGDSINSIKENIISANAYVGVAPIVEALKEEADIIVTGRVADPALFMAPAIFEFGWSMEDYTKMGKGIVLGHMMECGAHVTGGYFADPGFKEVPDIANLGFPIAEVNASGDFYVTKLANAGGLVTIATCKEQLLYEIHDPENYLTPDVVADFSNVKITEIAPNRVQISGGEGKIKTGNLKVSVGYKDGFIGEGQISYGGPGAVERAKLAISILKKRIKKYVADVTEVRYDIIGQNSLYGNMQPENEPYEVRVRVAARTSSKQDAIKIGNEVESLYTNGPAGGGGAFKNVQEIVAMQSILIDEGLVKPELHYITI